MVQFSLPPPQLTQLTRFIGFREAPTKGACTTPGPETSPTISAPKAWQQATATNSGYRLSPQTKRTWKWLENPPWIFEDVFPIESMVTFQCHLSFQGCFFTGPFKTIVMFFYLSNWNTPGLWKMWKCHLDPEKKVLLPWSSSVPLALQNCVSHLRLSNFRWGQWPQESKRSLGNLMSWEHPNHFICI